MGNIRDHYEQTLNELKDQIPDEQIEDLRLGYNAGITEKKVGERAEVLLYAIESLDDAYQEGIIEDEETQQQIEYLQEWAQNHEYIDWTNKKVRKDQIDEDMANIADSNQDPIPLGEEILYEIDTILNEAVHTYNHFIDEISEKEYNSGSEEEPTDTEFGTVLDPEENEDPIDSELEPEDPEEDDDDLGTLFPDTEDDTTEDPHDPSDTEDYDSDDEGSLFGEDDLDESTGDRGPEDFTDDGFDRDDTATDDGPSDSTTDWGTDPGTDRGDSDDTTDDTDPTGFDPIDPDDGDDGPTDWDDGSSDDTHDYGKPDDTLEWLGGVAFGEYKLRDFTLGLRGNRRD